MPSRRKRRKEFIKESLFAYTAKDGRTPCTKLLDLSAEMSGLPKTELTWLTKAAGAEIFKLLTVWCESIGVDEQLSGKTHKVNNPEENIADLYGNEKKSLLDKRAISRCKQRKVRRCSRKMLIRLDMQPLTTPPKNTKSRKTIPSQISLGRLCQRSRVLHPFDDSDR
ncbi:hypothetical protein MMC06_001654 [Schaereria dolodes]|nr:hypothetical protein [Schaereria dolodes]